jgi:hypothetical protein
MIYSAGQLVTPHTANEHAIDVLNYINAILKANGVVDSNGNVMQLTPNMADAMWILCLAVGDLRADDDQVLVAGGQQFSVSECSDAQLQAVLPVAGTSLIPAAYSLVTLRVTAGSGGSAVIPLHTSAPWGTVCNFLTQSGPITIPAGTYADILCKSDTAGPIEVPAYPNGITAFSTTIAIVQSVNNPSAAIPGRNIETIQQVRQRLLQGNISDLGQDGTQMAILSIQGIVDAKVYFNFDTVNNLTLTGGTVVGPRRAYVVVEGTDPTGTAIALAYAKRMSAPTQGGSSQTYTTLSGQAFTVYYDAAVSERLYVKVYYDSSTVTASGFATDLATILADTVWHIGQSVTASLIDQALQGFPYALVTGSQVSTDGATWKNEVLVNANAYAAIASGDVTVVAQT